MLKPAVGLDGFGVRRIRRGAVGDQPRDGAWILQPFLREAAAGGEVSIILIEGEPTHAVRRLPPPDDFRAQERLGGTVRPHRAPPALDALARRVVDGLERTPLYARVDIVERADGPVLMELELVEPSLFFEHGMQGLDAMSRAISARLEGKDSAGISP